MNRTTSATLAHATRRFLVLMMVVLSCFLVLVGGTATAYADGSNARISAPSNGSIFEVGKEVTVTAKADYQNPYGSGHLPARYDYLYFKVTLNGERIHYDSASYGFSSILSKSTSFTPETEGEYLIEVCRDLTYVDGEHVELAYEDFVAEASVTITVQRKISKADVTGIESKVYTGSALTQDAVLTIGDKTLELGTDYDVSYANNINVGTASVTFTGKGFYKGTRTENFQISPADISSAQVTGIVDKTYTGSALVQDPVVTWNNQTLNPETDYDVTYENNTNAGTANLIIAGKGNFAESSITKTFKINAAPIKEANITGIRNKSYTGNALTQTPVVKYNGTTLTEGTDYTLSYKDNTNLGTATVTISGKGNFTGKATRTFSIVESATSSGGFASILSPADNAVFAKGSDITVKAESSFFHYNYYQGVELGVPNYIYFRVTRNGESFIYGKKSFTSSGQAVGIQFPTYDEESGQYYNGEYRIEVCYRDWVYTVNGTSLSYVELAEEDFVANDSVTVYVGISAPTGKKNIAQATVSGVSDKEWTGNSITQSPVVKHSGTTLRNGTDYYVTYTNNLNKGTATLTIHGMGNYIGTKDITFQITGRQLTESMMSFSQDTFVYNGSPQKPAVTVSDPEHEITTPEDYRIVIKVGSDYVPYDEASTIEPGTYAIQLLAMEGGDYSGRITKEYTITKIPISDAVVTASPAECTYDGTAKEPSVSVKLNGADISSDLYSVSYSKNTDAGTATATITAKEDSHYEGSASGTFTIKPYDIASNGVKVTAIEDQTYNRNALAPVPQVSFGDRMLESGKDFTTSYDNNTNVGTATATIKGSGNFKGSREATFSIKPKSIADESITIDSISDQVYAGGSAVTPKVTVKDGGAALTESDFDATYQDNDKPGTATVTITGKGNYTGTRSDASFTIKKAPMSNASVEVSPSELVYDGSAKEPSAIVKLNDADLASDLYTVGYSDNIDAGAATVTVTATEDSYYTGSASGTFTIKPYDIASDDITVNAIEDQIYNRKPLTPVPEVSWSDKNLKAGADFTVSYGNNTNVGTASVEIKGTGNFKGSREASFAILQKDIGDPSITVDSIPYQLYTEGKPATPKVTVRDGGTVLTASEFEVSYTDNDRPGNATVTIAGKGNYTGARSDASFEILKANVYASQVLADRIDELAHDTGSNYLPADRAALQDAIDAAKKLLADGNASTEELEQALAAINAAKKTAESNYANAEEVAQAMPTAASTEKSILSQKTDKDPTGSSYVKLKLKSTKQAKKYIKLSWSKVAGASKYIVFGNKCGKSNKIAKIATVTANSYTHKKLKKGTYYKFVVTAVKSTVSGERTAAVSTMIHVATKGGKVGNHKTVTVKIKSGKKYKAVTKIAIKKGKSLKLKAEAKPASKKLKVKVHVGMRYQSSNTRIATVSTKGKIAGKTKGTCYVYAYAQNGVSRRIKVSVK